MNMRSALLATLVLIPWQAPAVSVPLDLTRCARRQSASSAATMR